MHIYNRDKTRFTEDFFNNFKKHGITPDLFELDVSNALGEGHGYLVDNTYYKNCSDVLLTRKLTGDRIEIWLDFAYTQDMDRPQLFISSKLNEQQEKLFQRSIFKIQMNSY